jgi:hypothetical protein
MPSLKESLHIPISSNYFTSALFLDNTIVLVYVVKQFPQAHLQLMTAKNRLMIDRSIDRKENRLEEESHGKGNVG